MTLTIPTASSSPSQTFAQVVALLPAPIVIAVYR
jgi:hypothetical protein